MEANRDLEQRLTALTERVGALESLALPDEERRDLWGSLVDHEEEMARLETVADAGLDGALAARGALRRASDRNTDLIEMLAFLMADAMRRLDVAEHALTAAIVSAQGSGDQWPESPSGRFLAQMAEDKD